MSANCFPKCLSGSRPGINETDKQTSHTRHNIQTPNTRTHTDGNMHMEGRDGTHPLYTREREREREREYKSEREREYYGEKERARERERQI